MIQFVAICFGILSLASMTLTEELELCKGKKLNVDMELGASVVCHEQLKDGINITTELSDGEAVDIYVKTCFGACVTEKLNIVVNDAGNPEGVTTYVESTFPESLQKGFIDGINSCLESNGNGLSKDNNCESYAPLIACIFKLEEELC